MQSSVELDGHDVHVANATQGSTLTTAEAEQLEQILAINSYDLAARFKLLGYYLRLFCQGVNINKLRALNIIWLIDNVPECALLASQYGMLSQTVDADSYAEAKKHWLQKIDNNSTNAAITGNAAEFFIPEDLELAETLFRKCITLAPGEPKWSRLLATALHRGGPARAAEALTAMRQAIAQEPEERLQYHMLDTLAELALWAGNSDEAFDAALKCLTMAFSFGQDDHDGNAIHNSNCIMGRIALREGDLETAKRHLVMAGESTGSATLALAPNMTLAHDLLLVGESETVIEYLQACSKFWTLGRDMGLIDQWVDEIRQNQVPDMSAFVTRVKA